MLSKYKKKQAHFSHFKAQLIIFAHSQGYCLVEYEGCVMPDRKSRTGRRFRDAVHMKLSLSTTTAWLLTSSCTTVKQESLYTTAMILVGSSWENFGSLSIPCACGVVGSVTQITSHFHMADGVNYD